MQMIVQTGDETFFRAMMLTGLMMVGATVITSSTIRRWMVRTSIELITQRDLDDICKTIAGIDEDETSLQWIRDKNRIAFVGTNAHYIDERMQWVIPFVTQTAPNSIWCVLNTKNGNDVVFTSPSNGLSVHRISDVHIRCYLNFLVMRLDDNNMVCEAEVLDNVDVNVTYDIVDTRYDSDAPIDPHILLIGCIKR